MAETKKQTYIEGIGRRKEAIARVRIMPGSTGTILINDKPLEEYFSLVRLHKIVQAPFMLTETGGMSITVQVKGGGTTAQAEAIRLGISRALIEDKPELRGDLKKAGFLKRDSRSVERKKFGLKKARKSAQWSKR